MTQDTRHRASLTPLMELVAADMEKINELILSYARSHVETVEELARHLIDSGGKRIRPMVTLAAAALFDYDGELHIPLATSVEFLHTATLLHDDVVDESDMRRGRKTARLIWGNQATVLVGDYLLAQTFRMIVQTELKPALRLMSDTAAILAEGEVWQLTTQHDVSTSLEDYMRVIEAKTAALFAAAAELGAIVADRPAAERKALNTYGHALGMAFQLVDDALDYAGETGILGKAVGDDFREGKITMPVVLALQRTSAVERAFLIEALEEGEADDTAFARALEIMQRHDAIADTIAEAQKFGQRAREALAIFAESPARDALIEAVDFCIQRVN